MIGRKLFVMSAAAVTALAPVLGWAQPIRIDVTPAPEPRQVTVVTAPSTETLVAPETLQVDNIRAQQVRARTIYANQIDANQVRGVIYQTSGLQGLYGHGQVNVPDVAASVIYADTITANVVAADAIYVRDLRINR